MPKTGTFFFCFYSLDERQNMLDERFGFLDLCPVAAFVEDVQLGMRQEFDQPVARALAMMQAVPIHRQPPKELFSQKTVQSNADKALDGFLPRLLKNHPRSLRYLSGNRKREKLELPLSWPNISIH